MLLSLSSLNCVITFLNSCFECKYLLISVKKIILPCLRVQSYSEISVELSVLAQMLANFGGIIEISHTLITVPIWQLRYATYCD